MSKFKIDAAAKPIVRSASRTSIEAYFIDLPSPQREQEWLANDNRYREECVSIFESDAKRTLTKHKHKHLKAYVGASSPTHIIDAWSFLGRSIDCALRGDTYSASHFAYYAELRAAMALLASEGVGIFSGIHAIVGTTASLRFPRNGKKGTHAVIWPLLRYWSTLTRSGDLFDGLIQPEQLSLSTWLHGLRSPIPVSAIGRSWLASWGLDLANFQQDHDIRNLASYRPSELRLAPAIGSATIAEFICSLWNLFEPGTDRRFQQLERYLLRQAWKTGGGNAPTQADIERVGLTPAKATEWAAFLAVTDDPLPLEYAENTVPIEDATCHLRIISRAALLLFVASGAVRQKLQRAGYTIDTISFWWKRQGTDRGLWDTTDLPDDPLDAWADVANAINDVTLWRDGNRNASMRQFRQDQRGNITELGSFELVGIWSLLP
jgi:hypothetical protein